MKKNARKYGRSAFALLCTVLLILCFQNCSNGFQSAQIGLSNATTTTRGSDVDMTPAPTETPDVNATATPTPMATASATPTSSATPSPSPAATQKTISQILVGTSSKIKHFQLNHETDALSEMGDIALQGQTPGWFAFDASTSRVYAADAQGGNLNRLAYNGATGALVLEESLPFLKRAVHLGFEKTSTGWYALGASYDDARFARYEVSADGHTSRAKNIMDFDTGAKTHSSSFDSSRGLVFVSNLGQGNIVVYKDDGGDLRLLTKINVVNPRIVMYDAVFDKLYVVTEAYSGNSFVKIYGISPNAASSFDFTELGSFKMALSGGDLKIDHVNHFIGATVREEGKQGVWVLPIKASDGLFDSARENVFMPMEEFAPRSLQISSDGRYYVVTCDSSKNTNDLVIFKMTYAIGAGSSSGSVLSGHAVLKKVDLGSGSFLSNFMF